MIPRLLIDVAAVLDWIFGERVLDISLEGVLKASVAAGRSCSKLGMGRRKQTRHKIVLLLNLIQFCEIESATS
jgi:hypothetical protein